MKLSLVKMVESEEIVTLGNILLMDVQNKLRYSKDAHRSNTKLCLAVPLSLLWVHATSVTAGCKTNAECYFSSFVFFGKSKNPPQISSGWQKQVLT